MMLKGFEMVKQGAEAKLYRGEFLGQKSIVKERFKKTYRHPQLDASITRERVKAEARALNRSKAAGVHSPAVYFVDVKRGIIIMEEVQGETAKDCIDRLQEAKDLEKLDKVMHLIGEAVGRLHSDNLIHGDLTTSNVLVTPEEQVVMIDFGLSHVSNSAEDKAVDLYVLERAFVSTHPDSEELFSKIMESYIATFRNGSKSVVVKLEEVRARGRKRTMVG